MHKIIRSKTVDIGVNWGRISPLQKPKNSNNLISTIIRVIVIFYLRIYVLIDI